jgi:hypothetical protein
VKRATYLVAGLVLLTLFAGAASRTTASQEDVPTPNIEPLSPTTNSLVPGLQLLFPSDSPIRLSLVRYTFAPGESAELSTNGAVIFYIDQGELGITSQKDQLLILLPAASMVGSPIQYLGVAAGKETLVQAGHSVYAEDGQLGLTRSAGNEELIVLAIFLAPTQGEVTSFIAGTAATPSP